MKKIIFIGLGTMGYHMAGHLSKYNNIKLSVFNRTNIKAKKWAQEFNGKVIDKLDKQLANFDLIILCAGRDEDLAEIFFNEKNGIIKYIKKGATVIDHTTISYDMTIKIANALAANAINFLDAPVSGGEIGAQKGTLSIMVGGASDILNKHHKILSNYAHNITHMGNVGNGQITKMVNQISIAGVLQGLSEALIFAEKNNLDIPKLLNAISGGAASSWQMQQRLLTMHKRNFDFGFAIKWMVKDLHYALSRAKNYDLNLSLTSETIKKYEELVNDGLSNLDTSSLILAIEKNNK